MVEAEFPKLLHEFQKAAVDLNLKSNGINTTLFQCELALVNANAGIEYWSRKELLSSEPETDEDGKHFREADRLGFAKVDGEWHLAVQHVTKEWYTDDTGDQGWEIASTEMPVVLSQASRELRIAALEELPDLIAKLTAKALQAIKSIESAQKLLG